MRRPRVNEASKDQLILTDWQILQWRKAERTNAKQWPIPFSSSELWDFREETDMHGSKGKRAKHPFTSAAEPHFVPTDEASQNVKEKRRSESESSKSPRTLALTISDSLSLASPDSSETVRQFKMNLLFSSSLHGQNALNKCLTKAFVGFRNIQIVVWFVRNLQLQDRSRNFLFQDHCFWNIFSRILSKMTTSLYIYAWGMKVKAFILNAGRNINYPSFEILTARATRAVNIPKEGEKSLTLIAHLMYSVK